MTEDTSPENLRKFLESDDPALVRMGLSMAKGTEGPEDYHQTLLHASASPGTRRCITAGSDDANVTRR